MPEGDTIHTLAAALRTGLVGRRLERVSLHGRPAPSLESAVVSVEARGKNLLIELASGELARVHLGMHGEWHRYPSGARSWKKPRRRASLVLHAGDDVFVCFDAAEIEFVESARPGRSRRLRDLGPDLISDPPRSDVVVERARRLVPLDAPVVDLLLDQRVAAGIGNVYKSELLFLRGLSPDLRVVDLEDSEVVALYALATELLRSNLGGWLRTTTHDRTGSGAGAKDERGDVRRRIGERGPRLWVYGRVDEPCLECSTAIRFDRRGRGRRSTYWCPSCQPSASSVPDP